MDEFDCDICKGTGGIPHETVVLHHLCPKCKGKMKLDWIEKATSECYVSPEDQMNKRYQLAHYNIHLLERLLRDECFRLNIKVNIAYDKIEEPNYCRIHKIGGGIY